MAYRSSTVYQHNLDELFADSDSELSDFEGFVKALNSKLAIKFTLTVSLMKTSGRMEIEMTTPSRLPSIVLPDYVCLFLTMLTF